MRPRLGEIAVLLLLNFWILAGESPARATDWNLEPYTRLGKHWSFTGYWRTRLEYVNFFDPKAPVGNRDEYAYPGLLGRLGVKFNYPWIEGLGQGQLTGLWNLPGDADGRQSGGPLGPGATYYAHHARHNQGRVFLHQGFIKLKPPFLPGFALQAGRFEYFLENEFKSGDQALDFLRAIRIGQRLVGPFGFSHIWRSFDGVLAAYDDRRLNVTVTASHPTQGGFEIDGMDEISHIDLVTGVVTAKAGALLPRTEAAVVHVTYRDRRGVTPTDNRSLAGLPRPSLRDEPLQIHTLGGHILGVYPLGPGALDALVWGVGQWGHWGNQRHRAYAYAVEAGYQFRQFPWQPWLRLGWFTGSGDSDPSDGSHESFFQVLPTARLYAFFPFYNLMNNRDLFFQVFLYPYKWGFVRVDYHSLWLDEGNDLWYYGAGPTRRDRIFGYSGRNSGGRRSLAQVAEITFRHRFNKHLTAEAYWGHAFGQGATDLLFSSRSADFFFLEMVFQF